MSVNGWPGLLGGRVERIGRGEEPVPVQHGHIVGGAGAWVPAEQVVVVLAHLARAVVMADVVKVGLRQRRVHEAEDQDHDPHAATTTMPSRPTPGHAGTSNKPTGRGEIRWDHQRSIIDAPRPSVKSRSVLRVVPVGPRRPWRQRASARDRGWALGLGDRLGVGLGLRHEEVEWEPLDDAQAVAREDAGDGREVVADDRWEDSAAVAPVAQVAKQGAVVGGLVERQAAEARLDRDIGQAPEAGTVEGVDPGAAELEVQKQTLAVVEAAGRGRGCEMIGHQPAVQVGAKQDEFLPRRGNRRCLGEDLPRPQVADDPVVLGNGDHEQGRGGDPGQAWLAAGHDLARHYRHNGSGQRQPFLRRHRRHLSRQVAPRRVADQGEPAVDRGGYGPVTSRARRRRREPHSARCPGSRPQESSGRPDNAGRSRSARSAPDARSRHHRPPDCRRTSRDERPRPAQRPGLARLARTASTIAHRGRIPGA